MTSNTRARTVRRALAPAFAGWLALVSLGIVGAGEGLAALTVRITSTLEPATVTVTPGTVVTWVNEDAERHRVRSVSGPEEFDSGNLETGESFSFTFTAVGTASYVDDRNRDDAAYHGTVVVESPPESPPPGSPPPEEPPPPAPPPAGGGGETVSIIDRTYRPASVIVPVGSTVSWRNNDDRIHTVTATDRSYDSGIFGTGATYARTYAAPGTFDYFCTVHPDMRGRVTVTAPDGTPPPDQPPPEPDPAPAPPPAPTPPPTGDVRIVDFSYGPAALTVGAGATVTWANAGAAPHTVTATDRSYDSGLLTTGATYRRTFTTPGTYDYFCTIHPDMRGRVTVTAPDGTPPPDQPPPPTARAAALRPYLDAPGDAAAASSGVPHADDAPGARVTATVVDFGYEPAALTVVLGSEVAWTNSGVAPHTVTARDGSFDSGLLMTGDGFARAFTEIGTYEYFCTLHPDMVAAVRVVAETAPPEKEAAATSVEDVPPATSDAPGPLILAAPAEPPPLRALLSIGLAVLLVASIATLATLSRPIVRSLRS